ncbi:hypothetical protein N9995_00250 [bacterium]|nr:hypothetical protein [bacterium]
MDEGNIVNELMKRDAELICFDDFMEWSGGGKLEEKPEVFTDQFGFLVQKVRGGGGGGEKFNQRTKNTSLKRRRVLSPRLSLSVHGLVLSPCEDSVLRGGTQRSGWFAR